MQTIRGTFLVVFPLSHERMDEEKTNPYYHKGKHLIEFTSLKFRILISVYYVVMLITLETVNVIIYWSLNKA